MSTAQHKRFTLAAAVALSAVLALAGCTSSAPLGSSGDSTGSGSNDTIVVGSQAYFSNEIIAEIYSQALEGAGFTVQRKFNIGQRDAYMPAVVSGAITLFPEYTGNLLEYFDPKTTATSSDDVYAALKEVLPKGLTVLDQSSATDQDTYTVTKDFAAKHQLTSIGDLANVDVPLTIGAAPEFEQRPYGPAAALKIYGVTLAFSATGPTTLQDLLAGTVNVADIYSADPAFQTESIVALTDPKNMILASHVVPLVNTKVADSVASVINAVSAALTPEGLVSLGVQSTVDQMSAPDIAKQWLKTNGIGQGSGY